MGERHPALKIFLFMFVPICFLITLNFALKAVIEFFGSPELQKALGTTVFITSIFLYLLIVYFFLYGVYLVYQSFLQKKQEKLEF